MGQEQSQWKKGNRLVGQPGKLAGSLIGQMKSDAKFPLGQLRREGGSHSKERENQFLEEDDKLILEPVDRGPCGNVNEEEQEQNSQVWRPEERPGCEALRDLSALETNEIPRVC